MKSSTEQPLQLILFTLADRTLAIETACLLEVLEPLQTTPLPFVPAYVDGLINVSGQIIPQIALAPLILSVDTKEQQVQTLLVVSIDGVLMALRIHQVLAPVSIDASAIQPVKKNARKKSTGNVAEQYLQGIFVHNNQEVWLLDVMALKAVVKAGKKTAGKPGFLGEVKNSSQLEIEKFQEFLLIRLAGKDYALKLADIHEIIDLQSLNAQPRAPACVAGISLIRGEPRLILNLARLLDQQDSGSGGQTAIMMDCGDFFAGLLIDELLGLESIAEKHIRTSKDKKHQAVLRHDSQLLTPVIRPASLIGPELLAGITPFLPTLRQTEDERKIQYVELLRFLINGDAYAFPLARIKRVINDKKIEPLLSPHAYILGTAEVDGRVVPVIDLIAQLGYTSRAEQLQEFIVIHDGNSDWALAIYASDQIIAIDERDIDWVNDRHAHYVSAFANDNDALLTILDPSAICQDNQHRQVV